MMFLFSAFAGVPQHLLEDPSAALQHDWCAWVAQHPEPLDLSERLEDEALPRPHRTATKVVDVGRRTAASTDPSTCSKVFAKAQKTFEKRLAKMEKKIQPRAATSDQPEIREIQTSIEGLAAAEQAARRVYLSTATEQEVGGEIWLRLLAAAHTQHRDSLSTATLKKLLESWDWLDANRFGESVSKRAWLLAQHADHDPAFQAEVLERMKPHLDIGGVRKGDYAYLWDRVAVNHDRLQRYGTQPTWECTDGKLTLAPLEEPESVDARRSAMGLGTAQEQLDEMTRAVCR